MLRLSVDVQSSSPVYEAGKKPRDRLHTLGPGVEGMLPNSVYSLFTQEIAQFMQAEIGLLFERRGPRGSVPEPMQHVASTTGSPTTKMS